MASVEVYRELLPCVSIAVSAAVAAAAAVHRLLNAVWSLHAPFFSLSLKLAGSRSGNIVPGGCAAVPSRSASLHRATALLTPRGRASSCHGWTLAV